MTGPRSVSDELPRLTAVSRALSESASVDVALETAVTSAADLLGGGRAVLLLREEGKEPLRVRASHGLESSAVDGVEEVLSERLVRRVEQLLGVSAGEGLVGVPLIVGGAVVGILAAARAGGSLESPSDPRPEWLLAALADQAAVALARARQESVSAATPRLRGRDALSMVGHDLRSPRNAMKGYVHLLVEGRFGEVSDAQASVLERLERITDHMTALARNIQDFGQIAEGSLVLETCPVDLSAVVEEARAMVELKAKAESLNVVLSVPAALEVVAAPDRLRQVLVHLLDNAIKHAPQESRVEVSAETSGSDRVAILVADEGPGVPPGPPR